MSTPPYRPRPTLWQMVSTAVLLGLFVLPLWLLLTVPWGWAVFAAFCFWPASIQVGWGIWRHGAWPSIVGGPSVSWAGRSYGMTPRQSDPPAQAEVPDV